ncbi:TPA: hypothetical protein ACG7PQ_005123 [Klebsiella pneumoniae]
MADGFSGWIPVVSSFVGGLMAIGGVVVTQLIIACREQKAQNKKLASERAFIGAGLILYLQECCHQFTLVANDDGEYRDSQNGERVRVTVHHADLPDISAIEGDWTVLPGQLLLRIREIPRNAEVHDRYIALVHENELDYPEHTKVFQERRRRYQNLANQCVSLENELRTLCGFPDATDEE